MASILIVEDHVEINEMLKEYLIKDGYQCIQAFSGSEASLLLQKQGYDLVLLDLMLPGLSGEEVLALCKQQTVPVPVIVISAKDALSTKVEVLELGADDFICKPFDLQEVLARVHVQLRKHHKEAARPTIVSCQDLQLHLDTFQAFIQQQELFFTKHEFSILELLMGSCKQVFTKRAIYEYVWGDAYLGDERTVNTHVSNIRVKLRTASSREYIQTVWGIGFKMIEE